MRYDDDFEALKAEVSKQSAVAARTDFDRLVQRGSALVGGKAGADGATLMEEGGGPDYGRIVELSTSILSSKSKDLQVAGYLCLGLFRTARYAGLAESLQAYHALVDGYWDTLFPELKRMEGRRQAVNWLSQRLGDLIPASPPEPSEREVVEQGIALGKAIEALLRERFTEDPPSISALTRALTEALEVMPKAAAVPAAGAQTAAAPAPITVVVPAAPPASAAPQSEDDALMAVTRAADFLRAAQPKSPIGYRLLRSARWDPLPGLPAQQDGRTLIEPPQDYHRTRIQMALGTGDWNEVLLACEELFYESPNQFWLDLQRHADQALGALGPDYGALRRALRQEVARLIERIPGIETMSFADGLPFADGVTREWLDREIRSLSRGGAAAPMPSAGGDDPELRAQVEEAQKLAGDGDLAGALDKLQGAQAADARRRPRFLRQLAMARLCLAHGRSSAARPLLEELDELVERYGLKDWEPELCLQIWNLMRRCYESLTQSAAPQAKEDYQNRMERCFDKICRLDVRLAVAEGGRSQP